MDLKEIKRFFLDKEIQNRLFAIIAILALIFYGYNSPNKALGATYTFTQASWAGGATANSASHASNQSGWTEYSSADSGISSGTNLQLGTSASTTIITNDTTNNNGFNKSDASNSNTAVSGTGDSASVKLSTTGAVSWSTAAALDSTGTVGQYSSIAVASDGFARISYYDGTNGDLKFIQCTNASCSTKNTTTVDSTGTVGLYTSMALGSDGFARISYYDSTNADLKFVQCTNASCSTKNTTTVDSTGTVGLYTSMALGSDGFARITYWDSTNSQIKYAQCTNASCSTNNLANVVADADPGVGTSGGTIGSISLAVGSDNFGRIAFYNNNGSSSGIKFVQCTNASCSTSNISAVGTTWFNVGGLNSIVLGSDGYGRMVYDRNDVSRPAFVQCTDASCSASNITNLGSSALVSKTAVAMASDGFARIAYQAGSSDLMFSQCTNASCSTNSISTLDSTGDVGAHASLVLNSDLANISYYDVTNADLKYIYQYSPYNSSGTYTSGAIDAGGNVVSWGNLSWTAGGTGTITLKARSADNSSMTGATAWASCASITSGQALSTGGCVTNGHRYIQYQASLSTSDTSVTPTLDDVTIGYNIYAASAALTSSTYDSSSSSNVMGGIAWDEDATLPSGTTVTLSLRTASTANGLSSASWINFTNASSSCTKTSSTVSCTSSSIPSSMKDGSGDEFFQYKVTLTSTGASTPAVDNIVVTYVVNAAPNFDTTFGTNGVSVSQISDSADANWGKVQIQYKVRDTDTSSGTATPGYVTPSFEYNTGSGWTSIGSAYLSSGALTNKAVDGTAYNTYTVIWSAPSQISTYSASAQVRVTVNDNEAANNTASATSASFALDAALPTLTTFTFDSTSNKIALNTSDNTNISYKLSNNSDLSADGLNSISGSWQSVGGTATNTSIGWTGTGSTSPEKIYVQVRDAYGNVTSGSLVAPAAPANLDIKDVSNVSTSEYRLFIAWSVYSATTSATFTNYKVYRSTDNSTYSLVSTITSASTNSYTDTSVASTTTYYYKVLVTDSDGDLSDYSSIVTDKPDGQGGTDVTPPTISSVSSGTPQATWATITWTTDELSNSTVGYSVSPSTAFGSTGSSNAYVTSHSVTLTGLTPNTTYLYRVRSADVLNNAATDNNNSSGYSFTTAQGVTISNVATESANDNSATITWNTNASSNSYVVYHTSTANLASGSGTSEVGSATLVATSTGGVYQHRVTLSGLASGTTYYYYVKSTDGSSNTVTDTNGSSYYSFKTTQDTAAPVISSLATPVISHSTVVITWQTDELADTWVEYGLSSGSYTMSTTRDSTLSIGHVATLTSLGRQTKYYFRVTSRDAQLNSASSAENSVTTTDMATVTVTSSTASGGGGGGGGSSKDTTPPKIQKLEIKDIGAFGANVSFETDEPTVSFADFGETAGYGHTSGSSEFKKMHSIPLSGLKMGTEYNVQAKAVDADGNSTRSENIKFKTLYISEELDDAVKLENPELIQEKLQDIIESMLPSLVPPFISDIKISDVKESGAVVTWDTNVPAFSSVAYVPEKDYDEKKENPYPLGVSVTDTKSKAHKIELSGLSPATTYHFSVSSFALPGVVKKSPDAIFTTRASKIKAEIAKLGNTEAEIRWVTPVETTSFIEYKDLATGKILRTGDNASVKNHSVSLQNLTPDTSYDIRAFGYDGKNNLIEADNIKIRTKKDNTPPQISSIKIDNALLPGRNDRLQTVISWVTDEPANSIVYYEEGAGKSETLANKTGDEKTYTTEHIVIITSLKQSTVYRIKINSKDESGNAAETPVRTILTPKSAESVLDVILKNFEESFGFLKKLR